MRDLLGQPVIIENVTGQPAASVPAVRRAPRPTAIRFNRVLEHTFVNGAVCSLDYDVVKDFEPISLLAIARC